MTFEKYLVQIKKLTAHTAKVYNKSWNTQDAETEPKRLKLRTATKHYHQYTQYLSENNIPNPLRVTRLRLTPEQHRRARDLITGQTPDRSTGIDISNFTPNTSSRPDKEGEIVDSIRKIVNLNDFTAAQKILFIKTIIKNKE